nr:YccF domain-containing protein [Nonomuraea polychroma]
MVAGIWLAIGHVVTSIPLFISIIGISHGRREHQDDPGLPPSAGRPHRRPRLGQLQGT